ncbi:MAG: hypothetical protein KGL34_08910 [Gammaproteobacteria bacterium]|nr:hypothetical protein [Gammaproteobacteria bacterium]
MKTLFRPLALLLLLLTAQQGAVLHELGHLASALGATHAVAKSPQTEAPCALCPAFAQVVVPACSHPYPTPTLALATAARHREPQLRVPDSTAPRPRSRGPPFFS